MRKHHTVDSAGRRRCGSIQVGVAIEPQQIDVLVVAASGSQQSDDLHAISAENKDERAALHRAFRASLEIIQSGDNFGQITGPAMFIVVGKVPGAQSP